MEITLVVVYGNKGSSSYTFNLNYIATVAPWKDMLLQRLLLLRFALTRSRSPFRDSVIRGA